MHINTQHILYGYQHQLWWPASKLIKNAATKRCDKNTFTLNGVSRGCDTSQCLATHITLTRVIITIT